MWHNDNSTKSLLNEAEKDALVWVKPYRLLNEELQHFNDIRQLIFRYLKQRHYTPTVIDELKEELFSLEKKLVSIAKFLFKKWKFI